MTATRCSLKVCALAACLALLGANAAQAEIFNGGVANPGDYNDGGNWDTGNVPAGGAFAIIGDAAGASPGTANLNAAPVDSNIGDLRVGNGPGGTGTLNHITGNLSPATFNWSFIGVDGTGAAPAVGTYNLSGDASITNSIASFDNGAGNLFLGIGGGRRAPGELPNEGYLTVADDALVSFDHIYVGNNDDNYGQVDQTGGTVVAGDWISLGRETGATGVYNMSGGSLAVTNDGISVGESTGATGFFNLSGDATVNAGNLRVGRSLASNAADGGGTGTMTVTGPNVSVTVGQLSVGANDGVVNDGQGTLEFTSDGGVSTINVLGDITLNDGSVAGFANLLVDLETSPVAGDVVLIDVAGVTNGEFAGLPEGSAVPNSGGRTITYSYGGGSSVALVAIPEPAACVLLVLGAGIAAGRRRS